MIKIENPGFRATFFKTFWKKGNFSIFVQLHLVFVALFQTYYSVFQAKPFLDSQEQNYAFYNYCGVF